MHSFIRIATKNDVEPVARAMRVRDVEEIRAASGQTPHAALQEALEVSTYAWAVCDDTGPFALFGVSPFVGDAGSPWMLATGRVKFHKRIFIEDAPHYIQLMQDRYPILLNYVDARHIDSLRWLRRMGFRFTGFSPTYGFERRPFFQFSKVSPCAHQ